ncbi:MAG TPA: hypothetical protein VFQ74_06940 [Pseudolysinimonas sp.]|nr:hypothetical protein [Pseudolysinimonas sp.]
MILSQRWGFSVVIAAVVGVAVGVLIAVLAGLGTGPRLAIGVGIGLIIGGGLLAIFDRLVVRHIDTPTRAVISEKLAEPVVENGMSITHRAIPAFDPETGEPLLTARRSSFVRLSLEVWTLLLVGFGILVVGVGLVIHLSA